MRQTPFSAGGLFGFNWRVVRPNPFRSIFAIFNSQPASKLACQLATGSPKLSNLIRQKKQNADVETQARWSLSHPLLITAVERGNPPTKLPRRTRVVTAFRGASLQSACWTTPRRPDGRTGHEGRVLQGSRAHAEQRNAFWSAPGVGWGPEHRRWSRTIGTNLARLRFAVAPAGPPGPISNHLEREERFLNPRATRKAWHFRSAPNEMSNLARRGPAVFGVLEVDQPGRSTSFSSPPILSFFSPSRGRSQTLLGMGN